MDEDFITQNLNLFSNIYIFNELNNDEIQSIIEEFEFIEIDKDQILTSEGDAAEYFYIIVSGKVQIIPGSSSEKSKSDYLKEGECFGEDDIVLKRSRSFQAITIEPTRLFILAREYLEKLFKYKPNIRRNILTVIESRSLAKKVNLSWLLKDEILYLVCRKHEILFFKTLIIPSLLGLVSIPLFLVSTLNASSFTTTLTICLTILFASSSILWGVWNWLDWGNDFYIITNWRVLWSEKQIGISQTRRETHINSILALNVITEQLGRWLGYGNVEVRTYTGVILMKYIGQPNLFVSLIKIAQAKSQKTTIIEERKAMEAAIRKKFGINGNEINISETTKKKSGQDDDQNKQKNKSFLSKEFANFFKIRYESGGVITYRKHWLALAKKIGLSTVMLITLFGMTAFVLVNFLSSSKLFLSYTLWIILLSFLYLIAIIWWIYQYLDWSNDIYRLTPTYIFDIEKKPLGKEDKKTASLDSILSIEHIRNGIIELIFNFGQVIITVGQTKFIFHDVFNPGQIHQDVSDYIIAQNKRKQEAENVREREHMVEWLEAYDQEVNKKMIKKSPN
jgi:CRP-like cAMP-binding protein